MVVGMAGRRRYAGAVLALACMVFAGSGAVADAHEWRGAAWSAPNTLSVADGSQLGHTRVAVAGNGTAVVVWQRLTADGNDVAEAATRDPAERWSAPQALDAPGSGSPVVAIDRRGDALAVWGGLGIRAADRPRRGVWSSPRNLSAPTGSSWNPEVASDRRGDAVAVWNRFENGRGDFVQATSRTAGADWSAPQIINDPRLALPDAMPNARVAISEDGDAIAIWRAELATNTGIVARVLAATRASDGRWSPPETLTPDAVQVGEPRIGIDGRGDAVAVWENDAPDGTATVQTAARRPHGRWSALKDLASPAFQPSVAVGRRGTAVAVWTRRDDAAAVIQRATRTARGRWSAPVDLSANDGSEVSTPEVALNRRGCAAAVWMRSPVSTGVSEIDGATGTANGRWSAPIAISPVDAFGSFEPGVGISDNGTAVAAWSHGIGPTGPGAVAQAATHPGRGCSRHWW